QQDIEERRRYEVELLEARQKADSANRAKSNFLANMSHEIRTPMNAVLGFAEILQSKESDPKKRGYSTLILSSGHALLSLINDILDLSKIEAGKMGLEYSSVSLQDLLEEVRIIFEQKFEEKGLELSISWHQEIPSYLIMDETRMRQILINLIGNAVKFTEHGFVRLTAECEFFEETHSAVILCIKVQDSGIGIAADQQDKIFGTFEQMDNQSNQKFGGTGLGLAISKRLVEIMEGSLSVESEVGKGATFIIQLPRVEVAVAGAAKVENLENFEKIHFEPATVLIVDDINYNRDILENFLDEFGFTLYQAADGKEALKLIYKLTPDLVLLDMKMPVLNGYDVCRAVKDDVSVNSIPIVAVTASALKKDEEIISSYCSGYLRKPLCKADLVKEVMKHLPYTISETDVEPLDTSEKRSVTFEQINQFKSIVAEKNFIKIINDLSSTVTVNELTLLCNEFKSLSQICPESTLLSYIEHYENAVNNFDIKASLLLLKEFPQIITAIGEE
ncbi:MAG: response regulator, partial [Lentisphaeraceae bacterium]|nr:response regulator [Lentisphaeraceae bacterium]